MTTMEQADTYENTQSFPLKTPYTHKDAQMQAHSVKWMTPLCLLFL